MGEMEIKAALVRLRDKHRTAERQLADATMFMRRMARCIDKEHPIRIAAQNWLIREGLQGSPLRGHETNGGE